MTRIDPSSSTPRGALSNRIRALAAAGHSRADIARMVDRSYQQVRQVLVTDEARRRRDAKPGASRLASVEKRGPGTVRGMAEANRPFVFDDLPVRLEVGPDGRLVLPAEWQVAPGSVFMARRFGGDIVMMNPRDAAERARMEAAPDSMVDALIAERRWESMREFDD